MIRKLLATTAIVSVASLGGMAATAQQPQPQPPAAAAQQNVDINYLDVQDDNSRLATSLIGMEVYASTADNAETIGEIEDLVLADDGSVDAVVIAVGGFLGVGEKDVAVEFTDLEWGTAADGEVTLILATTKEALEAAPGFEYAAVEVQPAPVAGTPAQPTNSMGQTADQAQANRASSPSSGELPAQSGQTAPAVTADQQNQQAAQNAQAPQNPAAMQKPDFSSMKPAAIEAVTTEKLINTTVYGADDANVGEINDLVLGADGKIDAVILDVGGFLGIGEKPVAIGFEALEILNDADGNLVLRTDFTEEQLNAAPVYVEQDYLTNRDAMRLTMVK